MTFGTVKIHFDTVGSCFMLLKRGNHVKKRFNMTFEVIHIMRNHGWLHNNNSFYPIQTDCFIYMQMMYNRGNEMKKEREDDHIPGKWRNAHLSAFQGISFPYCMP